MHSIHKQEVDYVRRDAIWGVSIGVLSVGVSLGLEALMQGDGSSSSAWSNIWEGNLPDIVLNKRYGIEFLYGGALVGLGAARVGLASLVIGAGYALLKWCDRIHVEGASPQPPATSEEFVQLGITVTGLVAAYYVGRGLRMLCSGSNIPPEKVHHSS
tara:strand:+ start:8608 stop:9078 length:471 start_codon:yes stop_codon:yes gene_type:complete